MVKPPVEGETLREIAARHGRASRGGGRASRGAGTTGCGGCCRRGRSYVYDPAAVDRVIAKHFGRQAAGLEPRRLYTAREIEALTGVTAATIRADVTRGRWPAPDDTSERAHRWSGETVTTALTARRGYRRSTEG